MGRKKSNKKMLAKEMYESGSSIEAIAKKLGYKEASVKSLLWQAGVCRKNKVCNYHDVLIQMRNEGKTLKEMSMKTGISVHSISCYLGRNGLRKRAYGRSNAENEKLLEKLKFAQEREPVLEKFIYKGKVYEDVTLQYTGWK